MRIVIDIPEDSYKATCEGRMLTPDVENVVRGIMDGIPIQNSNGRLLILSEDAVKREQIPLGFSCQSWISEVGLSIATVAVIEAEKKKQSHLWKCERCGKLIPYMADFCHECTDELLGEPPKPFDPQEREKKE